MTNTNNNKRSGSVEILYDDEWTEVKKTGKGQEKNIEFDITVPDNGHFQMRLPKGKKLRLFIENDEGQNGNTYTE